MNRKELGYMITFNTGLLGFLIFLIIETSIIKLAFGLGSLVIMISSMIGMISIWGKKEK